MKTNVLILVANSHKAMIFETKQQKGLKNHELSSLNLIKELEAELDEIHEKPVRTFNSVGKLRHGVEPHTDRRDVERQDFASTILQEIHTQKFDELIIFAADKFLHLLEDGLNKEESQKLKKKVNKNILDFKMTEMKEYIFENI